jgi:hypothetical protein
MAVVYHPFDIVLSMYYNISLYLTWYVNEKHIIGPTIMSLSKTILVIIILIQSCIPNRKQEIS